MRHVPHLIEARTSKTASQSMPCGFLVPLILRQALKGIFLNHVRLKIHNIYPCLSAIFEENVS